jgi:hypothetical protein
MDRSFVYEYSMQAQHSSYKPLMMETGTVSEISDTSSTLTWQSPDNTLFYAIAMET